jgi:hypothetical protein
MRYRPFPERRLSLEWGKEKGGPEAALLYYVER